MDWKTLKEQPTPTPQPKAWYDGGGIPAWDLLHKSLFGEPVKAQEMTPEQRRAAREDIRRTFSGAK